MVRGMGQRNPARGQHALSTAVGILGSIWSRALSILARVYVFLCGSKPISELEGQRGGHDGPMKEVSIKAGERERDAGDATHFVVGNGNRLTF